MTSERIRAHFLRAFGAAALVMTACQTSSGPRAPGADVADAAPAPPSSASASTSDAGAAQELATDTTDASVSPPPLRWGTRPDKTAAFSYVIDGYCVQAKVDLLPNATMVHYGEHGDSFAALATEDGLSDAERLSKGIDGYYLGDIAGTYPDNLWFGVDNGGRAFSSKHYMRFDKDHWAFGFGVTPTSDDRQLTALAPLPGGGALASMIRCSTDGYGACTELGVVSDGAGKAPPLGANGFSIQRILPFASGDVWAFGRACTGTVPNETCILQVRRWKPDTKVAVDTLPGAAYEIGSVVAKDAADVIVSAGEKYLHFDGAKWTTFAWSGRTAGGALRAAPDGVLWSLKNGILERRAADGTIAPIATPALVGTLEGVEVGAPWVILAGNPPAPARWDEKTGAFEKIAIPRSPFAWIESKKNFPTIDKIHVRSARDVWLNVKYTEFPAHYAEQNWDDRRALLRSIPPNETLYCNNTSTRPFISAPPLATPECKTPLVILANVEASAKTDYPQSRKLVHGKTELAGTRYVELTVDQRKILGAAVPSFDVGKKLLALMRASIPLVKPQMVCAAPSDAHEITLE